MHYYLVEKSLGRLISPDAMEAITTHLLNQSRNFYQIEVRILKEHLIKHVASAQTLPKEVKKKEEEEYEYFEEDDELDEEEKLMVEDDRANFNHALEKLKSTVGAKEGGKDSAMSI